MSPKIIMIIIAGLVMSGCVRTYPSPHYSVSAYNVVALKEINGTKLNVGSFTTSNPKRTNIGCRGAEIVIAPPDGQTFELFIRDSFIDELEIADAYSASAPITLTGNLDAIDFSSFPGGMWDIALTINSSNGNSFSISDSYSFTTAFNGSIACQQTAQALVPAVQNLIRKVVTNSQFKSLIN